MEEVIKVNALQLEKEFKILKVKCAKEEYSVILDCDDYISLENSRCTVVKQHGYATINVYTDITTKKRKSLGKIILNTNKNVYLKDRYLNKEKYLLDYRKTNLTTSIKEMEGYSEIARDNYYKSLDAGLINKGFKNYNMNMAKTFMKGKVGEANSKSKLTVEKVKEIRHLYSTGEYTQEKLAKLYNVSKSTISSIITYKRWKDIDFESKRIYNTKNVNIVRDKKFFESDVNINSIKLNSTYYIVEEGMYVYIEDLNNEGLVYVEIRDKENNVLTRADIYFLDVNNSQTNRNYSIASMYPARTSNSVFINHFDKLKMYI